MIQFKNYIIKGQIHIHKSFEKKMQKKYIGDL